MLNRLKEETAEVRVEVHPTVNDEVIDNELAVRGVYST
jgi:hypothetical protein